MSNITFNFEIQRKEFHLCSLLFPAVYIFVLKIIMSIILTIIAGLTFYLDISRNYNVKIKGLIDKISGQIIRLEDKSGNFLLSGGSYMAFGLLISCLSFLKNLAIVSWLVLTFSDCLAVIIGMKFGSPLFNGKSYIGTISFFISAILVSKIFYFIVNYNISFFIIIISYFLFTLADFFSMRAKINDNFSIPLTYAIFT